MSIESKRGQRPQGTDRQPPPALFKNSLRAWQAQFKAQREAAAAAPDKARNQGAPA
jgi:hypothetical protein